MWLIKDTASVGASLAPCASTFSISSVNPLRKPPRLPRQTAQIKHLIGLKWHSYFFCFKGDITPSPHLRFLQTRKCCCCWLQHPQTSLVTQTTAEKCLKKMIGRLIGHRSCPFLKLTNRAALLGRVCRWDWSKQLSSTNCFNAFSGLQTATWRRSRLQQLLLKIIWVILWINM